MSLDNIQLPVSILQSLYNKTLYDLNNDDSATSIIQENAIGFLGDNQKKVIILVNSEEAIYLPEPELNFLLGILTACRLSMGDVALINTANNSHASYTTIANQLNAEKLILFGVDPESLGLPLQFPKYQIQNFNNQVYLSSASLHELQSDKEEKLKLWNCLKMIFPGS